MKSGTIFILFISIRLRYPCIILGIMLHSILEVVPGTARLQEGERATGY